MHTYLFSRKSLFSNSFLYILNFQTVSTILKNKWLSFSLLKYTLEIHHARLFGHARLLGRLEYAYDYFKHPRIEFTYYILGKIIHSNFQGIFDLRDSLETSFGIGIIAQFVIHI